MKLSEPGGIRRSSGCGKDTSGTVASRREARRGNSKKIPEYVKAFDKYEGDLPPASNGNSVIAGELSSVAKTTHVLLEDQRFRQKDVPGRDLEEIELEATVSGDYPSIVRFLNALQRSKNTYIVDSLGLESESAPRERWLAAPMGLKVNLHLRTFFRKV